VAAARTAGGRRGGRLSGWHPADLAAHVIDALLERTNADPALDSCGRRRHPHGRDARRHPRGEAAARRRSHHGAWPSTTSISSRWTKRSPRSRSRGCRIPAPTRRGWTSTAAQSRDCRAAWM